MQSLIFNITKASLKEHIYNKSSLCKFYYVNIYIEASVCINILLRNDSGHKSSLHMLYFLFLFTSGCNYLVWNHFKISLSSFSPIGEVFRARLRQFPSLVTCCTIDWFSEWPEQALVSVANTFISEMPEVDAENTNIPGLVSFQYCPILTICAYLNRFHQKIYLTEQNLRVPKAPFSTRVREALLFPLVSTILSQ